MDTFCYTPDDWDSYQGYSKERERNVNSPVIEYLIGL